MQNYAVTTYVTAPSAELAAQAIAQAQTTQQVVVPVTIGAQSVEPTWMEIDTTVVDRIVRKVIAGVAIYYISKSLKKWAKS